MDFISLGVFFDLYVSRSVGISMSYVKHGSIGTCSDYNRQLDEALHRQLSANSKDRLHAVSDWLRVESDHALQNLPIRPHKSKIADHPEPPELRQGRNIPRGPMRTNYGAGLGDFLCRYPAQASWNGTINQNTPILRKMVPLGKLGC
jgi:hypothetical protein